VGGANVAVKPPIEAEVCRSLLGVDLAGSADDPLASRARALLAGRVVSLLVGLMTVGIGAVLIVKGWATLLGAALIAVGLLRFLVLCLAGSRRSTVYLLHNLSGALLVALGLYELGTNAGLEAWALLVIAIPPLLMGPQDGRARRVIYAVSVATVVAAELACWLWPPQLDVPADVLAGWRLVNFAGAAIVLAALAFVYRKTLDRAEARVVEEQKVAERLLGNILPAAIAERLKRDEYPIADAHEAVTVMFTDGVNFSQFAAQNSPQRVVELLNRIVYAFDDMVERRGIEKIKTMGDAYMAAAGLTPGSGDAAAVAELAFEMLDFVHELGRAEGVPIDLRIGINTGPLVAGVIGKRKFTYDVWGDTVNTAAHLERAGERGRIHISETTAQALGSGWRVEPRGPIALKGHASTATYFLLGRTAAALAAK
jgi:adenylate cyclase